MSFEAKNYHLKDTKAEKEKLAAALSTENPQSAERQELTIACGRNIRLSLMEPIPAWVSGIRFDPESARAIATHGTS
jgi:hypothetical protein